MLPNASFKPQYAAAVAEMQREEAPSYVAQETIQLDKVADTEPWSPSEAIKDLVPNIDDIQVEFITDSLKQMGKDLQDTGTIGLIVMGRNISRQSKPSYVVLTTESRIYALKPGKTKTMEKFLQLLLKNPKLDIWVTNGINESDCLYHNYEMDLSSCVRVNCCSGLNAHLVECNRYMPNIYLRQYFPDEAVSMIKRYTHKPLMIESFENMCRSWLGIGREDIYYDLNQLDHLNVWPPSLTAINVIKKRCVLVRKLALTLDDYVWKEFEIMNERTFSKLNLVEDELLRNKLLDDISKNESNGIAGLAFYQHLQQ